MKMQPADLTVAGCDVCMMLPGTNAPARNGSSFYSLISLSIINQYTHSLTTGGFPVCSIPVAGGDDRVIDRFIVLSRYTASVSVLAADSPRDMVAQAVRVMLMSVAPLFTSSARFFSLLPRCSCLRPLWCSRDLLLQ